MYKHAICSKEQHYSLLDESTTFICHISMRYSVNIDIYTSWFTTNTSIIKLGMVMFFEFLREKTKWQDSTLNPWFKGRTLFFIYIHA